MKVYLVMYWDYDGTGPEEIFSSEEKAIEWVSKKEKPYKLEDGSLYWSNYSIDEFEVDRALQS